MNFHNKQEYFTREDFEKEFKELQDGYNIVEIYRYWEETDSRYYLFDPQKDIVWQLKKRWF